MSLQLWRIGGDHHGTCCAICLLVYEIKSVVMWYYMIYMQFPSAFRYYQEEPAIEAVNYCHVGLQLTPCKILHVFLQMGCTWEVLSRISFETKRGESCRTSSSCRALAGRTAATTTGEANYAADRTLQLCQAFAWWFDFGKLGDKHMLSILQYSSSSYIGIYNSSITLESLSQPIYFQPEMFEAISTAIPTAHMFLWNGLQVLPPWVVHWKRRPFVAICGAFNGWWTGAMQMRY